MPVIVDCGALGGTWYRAHWAIAYAVGDGGVTLGAMDGIGNSNPTVEECLKAWHCWFLPAGFNHCGVFGQR